MHAGIYVVWSLVQDRLVWLFCWSVGTFHTIIYRGSSEKTTCSVNSRSLREKALLMSEVRGERPDCFEYLWIHNTLNLKQMGTAAEDHTTHSCQLRTRNSETVWSNGDLSSEKEVTGCHMFSLCPPAHFHSPKAFSLTCDSEGVSMTVNDCLSLSGTDWKPILSEQQALHPLKPNEYFSVKNLQFLWCPEEAAVSQSP